MLLCMGVKHHWWHLILRQAAWVRNYLERSVLPPKTTPHQLLTSKKPDLTLARVCGCMVQFMVTDHQHSGKLAPKARSGLHLCVSPESKGWEVLNNVVTTVEAVFYKNLSLGLWKAEYGPASTRAPSTPQTDSSSVVLPMLAEDGEPDAEDAKDGIPTPLPSDVTPSATPSPSPSLPVVDLPRMGSTSVAGDVGILGALPAAPPGGIAGGDERRITHTTGAFPRSSQCRVTLRRQSVGEFAGGITGPLATGGGVRTSGEELMMGGGGARVGCVWGAGGVQATVEARAKKRTGGTGDGGNGRRATGERATGDGMRIGGDRARRATSQRE
ncbi:unnamed protein product [Closterium sp. NIES-54]